MTGRRGMSKRAGGCLAAAGMMILTIVAAIFIFFVNDRMVGRVGKNMKTFCQMDYRQIVYEGIEAPGNYYYQALTEEKRSIYRRLLSGIENQEEEIMISSGDPDEIHNIYVKLLKDYPGIFWVSGDSKSIVYEVEEPYTMFAPDYTISQEEREERERVLRKEIDKCLRRARAKKSEYEKILFVYEYIVKEVTYDLNAEDSQNICSVFLNKRSVCAGYSKAAQLLLKELGIECIYVTGIANEGENHAWNIVSCQGDYYNLDVTWGDPVFSGSEQEMPRQDYVAYDYMCCDDRAMAQTHSPSQDVALPECRKMDMNYYVVNGMFYESYDRDEAREVLYEAVESGDVSSTFKFATREAYGEAKEDIYNSVVAEVARYMAGLYDLTEVTYQYITNESQNRITIFWKYQ